MPFDRSSGLLLHITSLPSNGGIGDLGPAAYEFADFLAAGKQRLWQVLPLSPTGYGNSPYAALSAFAGNPLLVSLELLAEKGWIAADRLKGLPGRNGNVDFDAVAKAKMPLLEEAAKNFLHQHSDKDWQRFESYRKTNWTWLDGFSLYSVLRRKYHQASWSEWPEDLKTRDKDAIQKVWEEHHDEIQIQQIIQFVFDEQWCALRSYCGEHDIKLIGDVAIFVNYDSADVWNNPGIFELREDLSPIRVAGVPPDYFSATGQRWGNPLYHWDVLREQGFSWWVDRVRRARSLYDIIRLDHFRGFEAFWAIPAENDTAVVGEWIKAPGAELFQKLRDELGELPFIAEDLGVITPEVDALREHFNFPGMRIFQFGFSDKHAHNYLPHHYVTNCVVYTGTHDNNTTRGWWDEEATKVEKDAAKAYLGTNKKDFVWDMIRGAEASVADLCLVPVQDILDLGTEARMNMPSRAGGNWSWRCPEGKLTAEIAAELAAISEVTDRDLVVAHDNGEASANS
ncbi:4-alpha-glucanotransferase [Silvibacterium bohemicum]|uniref:4-alpha-glucanotransferase n=1 Tax=Silvibacterium bohemicum TaxID=1577686 RepID=A0A841JYJ4_9BACT|nr:4-alpha-glucanotransferase [Silvibacterium bohemicum]MBB6143508.1 4-alpha-glucanotransferase [Silvibacterium bohemicum]